MGENAIKVFDIEKTIKRCEQLIKPENANWIGISNQEAIRELLNMLKEKDKEIEFQKDINKTEKDRHKKTEKSLKGQIIKNNKIIEKLEKEAQKYFEEIIKQDREMDLMADSFAEDGFYNEHCQTLIDNELCPDDCNKCVKQYFKSKAEKE